MHLVWNTANPNSVPIDWTGRSAAAWPRSRHTGRARVTSATRRKSVFMVIPLRSHSISNVACNWQGGSNIMTRTYANPRGGSRGFLAAAGSPVLRDPGQPGPAARHRHVGASGGRRTAHLADWSSAYISWISRAEFRKFTGYLPRRCHSETDQRFRHQGGSLDASVQLERQTRIGGKRRLGREH